MVLLTLYGLFNANIGLIYKYSIIIITMFSVFLLQWFKKKSHFLFENNNNDQIFVESLMTSIPF